MGAPGGDNSRKHARVRIRMIKCNLGLLRDLSLGGVRVEHHGFRAPAPGQEVRLAIEGLDRDFEIDARVKWARREGFRRHALGLEFIDVPESLRADLILLARSSPLNGTYERAEDVRRSA